MPAPPLHRLDHFVLTVASIEASCAFYARVLGMVPERFTAADGTERVALRFGPHKINLHAAGREFDPKAAAPMPGAADFCLLSHAPTAEWIAHLNEEGVAIEDGPVPRTGALGPVVSLYLRDPDGNLVEVSRPV